MFHKFIVYVQLLSLVVLSGCYPRDSACCGRTPACPGCIWEPSCGEPYEMIDDAPLNEALGQLQTPDVVIADLIDVALQNNPTTKETWANARAAAYGVGIAQSLLYPTATLTEQLIYNNIQTDDTPPFNNVTVAPNVDQTADTGDATLLGENSNLQSNLAINYLLFDFGGRCASIEAAKQGLYRSNWTHNRQVQQVIFSVFQTYFIYMGLSAVLEARLKDVENAKVNLQAATQLFEAGVKTKLDVLQAETSLVNAQLNVVDTEGQRKVALGALAKALGLPANAQFTVPEIPKEVELEKITAGVDKLVETAKQQRPDLIAAYSNREQRRANVVVARSAGLPIVTANLNFQQQNFFTNPSFNTHQWSAAVLLTVPIFDGYLNRNQVKQAKEFVRASNAIISETEESVIFDVVTSYNNFQTAVESYHYSDKLVKTSEETYRAALMSYQGGIGTILDLLSAQQALINARVARIQAKTKWAIYLADIAFSTGTLDADSTFYEVKP